MANWAAFQAAEPDMAAAGRGLIYQFGVGLGFLATIRADGGPRMHPICLVQEGDGLYAFIEDTPKRRDLERDGRFALHSMPPEQVDDEFYVTGRAVRQRDSDLYARVFAAYLAMGAFGSGDAEHSWLYEFDIETVMWAKYGPRTSWPPEYRTWKVPS